MRREGVRPRVSHMRIPDELVVRILKWLRCDDWVAPWVAGFAGSRHFYMMARANPTTCYRTFKTNLSEWLLELPLGDFRHRFFQHIRFLPLQERHSMGDVYRFWCLRYVGAFLRMWKPPHDRPILFCAHNERTFEALLRFIQDYPGVNMNVECWIDGGRDVWAGKLILSMPVRVGFRNIWLRSNRVRHGLKSLRTEAAPRQYRHLWPLAGDVWEYCGRG